MAMREASPGTEAASAHNPQLISCNGPAMRCKERGPLICLHFPLFKARALKLGSSGTHLEDAN
jgi:hypothetical protein